jgi:uncharacterized membrane protein
MASEVSASGDPVSGPPPGSGHATDTDDPLARAVGVVLQVGVAAAAVITAIGGLLLLRTHGADVPQFARFVGPTPSSTVMGALRGAAHGDSASLIQTGLLVLIATPVARVVMLIVGFIRERRWLYVALSAIVLGALAVSLVQSG